jgi:hypothetical protein
MRGGRSNGGDAAVNGATTGVFIRDTIRLRSAWSAMARRFREPRSNLAHFVVVVLGHPFRNSSLA